MKTSKPIPKKTSRLDALTRALKRRLWWIAAAGVLLLFVVAAQIPRFPLDLEATRAVQRMSRSGTAWTTSLTNTAKAPGIYVLLAATSFLAWRLKGVRAALLPSAAYLLVLGLDRVLKPWIARPRPSSDLVQVVGSSAGFGCPSTFGLVYAATVGSVVWLAWRHARGTRRGMVMGLGLALLLAGATARVVLGGHWPSDMILSYLLGVLVVTGLARWLGAR